MGLAKSVSSCRKRENPCVIKFNLEWYKNTDWPIVEIPTMAIILVANGECSIDAGWSSRSGGMVRKILNLAPEIDNLKTGWGTDLFFGACCLRLRRNCWCLRARILLRCRRAAISLDHRPTAMGWGYPATEWVFWSAKFCLSLKETINGVKLLGGNNPWTIPQGALMHKSVMQWPGKILFLAIMGWKCALYRLQIVQLTTWCFLGEIWCRAATQDRWTCGSG